MQAAAVALELRDDARAAETEGVLAAAGS